MSSTTAKHRAFVSGPMGDKPVTDLAGIGKVLGGRLVEKGINKAYIVLGHFLELNKNEEAFRKWLGEVCYADDKQAQDCYNCLKAWCDAFL